MPTNSMGLGVGGGGSGGLTVFSESLVTASPNNATNAALLIPTAGTTDVGTVIGIKGNGYLSTVVPSSNYSIGTASIFLSTFDGIPTSPFSVGANSLLITTKEPNAGFVVGSNAVAINGNAGAESVVISSVINDLGIPRSGGVAQLRAVAIGAGASSLDDGVAIGYYAEAEIYSVAIAGSSSSSGVAILGSCFGGKVAINGTARSGSVAIGGIADNFGTAVGSGSNANYGICLGRNSISNGRGSVAIGESAYDGDRGGVVAYYQVGSGNTRQLIGGYYFGQTTNATPLKLENNGATSANKILELQNNSALSVEVDVLARTSAGLTSHWRIIACFKRGANAAATSRLYAPIVTTFIDEIGVAGMPDLLADTTNGGAYVSVTGKTATTIDWNCTIVNAGERA